jgi:hypothetical protein
MTAGKRIRALGLVLAGLLWSEAALRAQVQVGSETQVSLDGSVSAGYSGSMTNEGPDSHGLIFGGTGNFSGSFHSPQFVSFDVAPFFNQSRANSGYQSITDASGVTASANIFGGSQFPGYISFSKLYNNESNYSIPGLANYATNSDSQTLGIGWSANFKNAPSFTFGYQQGTNDYSLYGTSQNSFDSFHSVFGSAAYTVDGFHFSGGIHYSNTDSLFPQIATGEPSESVNSNTTVYTFNVTRSLPLQGNTWVNFTRDTVGYESPGLSSNQTTDIVSGGLSLKVTSKLTAQFSGDYNDNLAGSIFQSIAGTGAIAPVSIAEAPSHSWGLAGQAQYAVYPGLYVTGTISHREQLFLGTSYDSNAFSGSVSYGHDLFGGHLTAGATVSEDSYGTDGGSMLGFLANATYIKQIGPWSVSGSFGYSQNVQSLLIAYTTSGYSYSVSANRRIRRLIWTVSGSGAKSLLTQEQGPNTYTQGYTTGLSGRWLGASFGYSKSSGTGLTTPVGIVPLPPGVPPTLLTAVMYGGTTYSASVGSTPVRRLTINGTYVHAVTDTAGGILTSNNKTEEAYGYMSYQFRKVYFNAGYSRLLQGFSATGLPPTMVSTYYFGVSRWFKAF